MTIAGFNQIGSKFKKGFIEMFVNNNLRNFNSFTNSKNLNKIPFCANREEVELKVKKLDKNAKLPVYSSEEAAGMDLTAVNKKSIVIKPGEMKFIPTGLAFEIPKGYEMQIRARSSMGKAGLIPASAVSTIDSDFRGHLDVMERNISNNPITIEPGMRFCQMVIMPVPKINIKEVNQLSETPRGDKGIGSSGKF